jgi:hypothetical protein
MSGESPFIRPIGDHRSKIRAEVEAMLDKVQASLQLNPSLTPLFTIRWEVQ